jgi:hypothetical protein
MVDTIPPEALLANFAPPTVDVVERLRSIVKVAIPGVAEAGAPRLAADRLRRTGGTAHPVRRVDLPERVHVHLGFVQGVLIDDREGRLDGRGEAKNARWLTWLPGEPIDAADEAEASSVKRSGHDAAARGTLRPRDGDGGRCGGRDRAGGLTVSR